MKHILLPTPAFLRSAKRHLKRHPAAGEELEALLRCLSTDPFTSALRTHKLKGPMVGSWAASGGYDLRIVFRLVTAQTVTRAANKARNMATAGSAWTWTR